MGLLGLVSGAWSNWETRSPFEKASHYREGRGFVRVCPCLTKTAKICLVVVSNVEESAHVPGEITDVGGGNREPQPHPLASELAREQNKRTPGRAIGTGKLKFSSTESPTL